MKKLILQSTAIFYSFLTVVFFAATLDTISSGSLFHIRYGIDTVLLFSIALVLSFAVTMTAIKSILEAE